MKKFWSGLQNAKKLVYNSSLDTNEVQHKAAMLSVKPNGGIAQLGERLHGMQEVIGSIPFTSTKSVERFARNSPGFDPIV